MTKISVILPFFNAEETLEKSLNSILQQSFTDFECIMVNNNSSDNSVKIAEKFQINDKRFKLINENRQGVAFASVSGSKSAISGLIARMDADDISFPERLELQYNYMNAHPDTDAVFGKAIFGGDETKASGLKRYVDWNNSITSSEIIRLRRFIESPVINPAGMWRKNSEIKSGGYKSGNFPEDYEKWMRWMDKGLKIDKLDNYVIKWNDSPGRLTRNDKKYSTDAFYEIKSKYLAKELSKINSHHPEIIVWGASRIMRRRAENLLKYGIKIKAWIDISEKRRLTERIIHYKDIPTPDKVFILIYVPQTDIRNKIEEFLLERNYREGINFLFAG